MYINGQLYKSFFLVLAIKSVFFLIEDWVSWDLDDKDAKNDEIAWNILTHHYQSFQFRCESNETERNANEGTLDFLFRWQK